MSVRPYRGSIVLLGVVIAAGLFTCLFKTPSILQLALNPGLTLGCLVLLVLLHRGQKRNAQEIAKQLGEIARLSVDPQPGKKDATLTEEQQVRLQLGSRRSATDKRKAPALN